MKRCYDFTEDQVKAIDRLSEVLGMDKTEVLTSGLLLLRHAVAEQKQGNALGVVNGDRVLKELVGIWCPPTAA